MCIECNSVCFKCIVFVWSWFVLWAGCRTHPRY